jgi:hypothetical protein
MADFYVLYFSLENSVRKLITDVLSEKHGVEWWEKNVPSGVKDNVKKLRSIDVAHPYSRKVYRSIECIDDKGDLTV